MKLTVIIPAYNAEQYIIRCLDSIPKREDVEVIVVNDCSTDNTEKIVKNYNRKYQNHRLFNLKKNVGSGGARNKAIEEAKGEYIFFLDSDDYFLEGINKLLDNLQGDIIYVGFELNNGTLFFKKDKNGVVRCIKKDFLGDTRYNDKRVHEDTDLYIELMKKKPIKNFTNILSWHYNYPREGSVTWQHKKRIILSIIIPVYNTEQYIKRCLDSIQLHPNIELIIIDDCSADNSLKIVKEWIKKNNFERITLIAHKKNLGVGITTNKAYDIAKGEYVMTVNDDDYLLEPISKLISQLKGEDIIRFKVRTNNNRIWESEELPGNSKAYKMSIIGNTRRPDQNFGGDKVFYEEIMSKNPTEKNTDLVLYHYNYPRKGSLMDQWKKSGTYQFEITIYTIIYNNYGNFLEQWYESVKKQTTKPKEVIVVLGNNHGVDKKKYKHIRFIEKASDVMGVLRNEAVKKISTEWMLYFSVDDELLPNAILEIKQKSKEADAVVLKYLEQKESGIQIPKESALITMENIFKWNDTKIPGYIAVKRKTNGNVLYYEEIEIPNYPYLFMIAYNNMIIKHTNQVCAIYQRRKGSHGDIANKQKKFVEYKSYINNRAMYYYNLKLDLEQNKTKIIKRKFMILKTKQRFQDKETLHKYRSNRIIEMPYNEERKIYLESNNLAEYIETREEVVYNVSGKSN